MQLQRVLQYAQTLLSQTIQPGETAVDATAGNGHDTLFLAKLVGETGHVYAFDIQEQAIEQTKNRLVDEKIDERATLVLDGHENITNYVQNEIGGAIFNLGYLPGANHEIVTKGNTTIQALEQLIQLLKVGGIIILVVYHGHEGGKEERDEVLEYVSSLPQKYIHVLRYEFINQKNSPPFIIALEKVKAIKTEVIETA